MAYPRDLDEIPAAELKKELDRRLTLERYDRCSYCREDKRSPPCKMRGRHVEYEFTSDQRARHMKGGVK